MVRGNTPVVPLTRCLRPALRAAPTTLPVWIARPTTRASPVTLLAILTRRAACCGATRTVRLR